MKPDDYRGRPEGMDGRPFKEWSAQGYTTIQPLPFLHGRPWGDVALGYVHALRPTRLRVVQDVAQLDAQTWRVTVWLMPDGVTIKRIVQEVAVGLPDGISSGHDLELAAKAAA